MALPTPDQYLDDWARGLKGKTEKIRRGVENTTEAPGMAAARQQAKMLQNLIEAIESGRWAEAVSAVSLSDWQRDMLTKGLNNLVAGIDRSVEKNRQTIANLLSAIEQVSNEVNRMPNNNIEDAVAKASAQIRGMHSHKGKIKAR